ncbi:MAG: GDSL-type esterase/lipase family protein [bacterium]
MTRAAPFRSRLRTRVVGSVLVAAVVFACAELALRALGFAFSPFTHYEQNDWEVFAEGENRVDYWPDPRLFWKLIPSRQVTTAFGAGSWINAHGMRGPETTVAKPRGVRRVITLGDSGTFGWEVPEPECYPRQLEAVLRKALADDRVEVVNAGIPGTTSLQGRRWFESRVVDFEPDVVVLAFGGNDGDRLEVADRARHILPEQLTLDQVLLTSRVYQLLYKLVAWDARAALGADKRRWVPRVSVEEFEENYRAILDRAAAAGAHAVLLARPGPDWTSYREVEMRLARERDLPYLDDGINGHPPGAQYAQVAQRVAAAILARGWLGPGA